MLGPIVAAVVAALAVAIVLVRRRWSGSRPAALRRMLDELSREAGEVRFSSERLLEAGPAVRGTFARAVAAMARGRWGEAAGRLDSAVMGATGEEKAALLNFGGICRYLAGRVAEAGRWFERSALLAREARSRSDALGNIGMVHLSTGKLGEATEYLAEALEVDRELGDRQQVAGSLGRLGLVHQARGEMDKALDCFQQAREIDRELGDAAGEATMLGRIGLVHQARGEPDKAMDCCREALARVRDGGHGRSVAELLSNIGLLHLANDETDESLRHLLSAFGMFMQLGGEARVLNTLAGLHELHGRMGAERFAAGCRKQGVGDKDLSKLMRLLDEVDGKLGEETRP